MSDALTASAAPPGQGHNKPPQSEAQKLFGQAKKALRASSRHTKEARDQLHAFLVHVMEICEYARQTVENRRAVELELHDAGVLHLKKEEGDWFRPLVTAAFDKEHREPEKTNISKYVSVLKHAERLAKSADIPPPELLKQLFADGASVAKLAGEEATARRADAAEKNQQRESATTANGSPSAQSPEASEPSSAPAAPPPTLTDLMALWDRADADTKTLFRQHLGCSGEIAVTELETEAP